VSLLKKIKGVWFGRLDDRDVIIIDPNLIDEEGRRSITEYLNERRRQDERRRHDERRSPVLVRSEQEADVPM
jgi:hypothetical protein